MSIFDLDTAQTFSHRSTGDRIMVMSSADRVPDALRRLREDASLSVRDLAARTYMSAGWISNIEHGRRWPDDRRWVDDADDALRAGGRLRAAWDVDNARRASEQRIKRMLIESAAATDEMLAMPDVADVDELYASAADLAGRYPHTPPGPMLTATTSVHAELIRRLREHAHQQKDLRDLRLALGHAADVLSYAALDLGRPEVADRHAQLSFRIGELAGEPELQARARGTQSLINRFERDYTRAFALVKDGLRYADHVTGTAGIRLRSGGPQCLANLGDADAALDYLDQADTMRAQNRPIDQHRAGRL
jgi:hypothetical protein